MTSHEHMSRNAENVNRVAANDPGWDSVADVPFNEEPVISEENAKIVAANMMPDQNATAEEQEAARQSQTKAAQNEITKPLTDGEFEDFVGGVLNEKQ